MSETTLETYKHDAPANQVRNWRRPVYDVSEDSEAFFIRVNLPGVKREGVDISIEDETLNIVATRAQSVPEGWRPLNRELPRGDYRLDLRLNVPINESEIKARVEHGVLELTLPKADEVKPRKIEVS
ncbi:MAG: Hsp20/alpha crystallin family protein [Opitutales bacterium]